MPTGSRSFIRICILLSRSCIHPAMQVYYIIIWVDEVETDRDHQRKADRMPKMQQHMLPPRTLRALPCGPHLDLH